MNYKITTLAENSVYGKGLQGEHGLSLLVEAGEHKVLFDTGASDLFLRNADVYKRQAYMFSKYLLMFSLISPVVPESYF